MSKYELMDQLSEDAIKCIEDCVSKGEQFYIIDDATSKIISKNVIKGYKAGCRDRLFEMGGIALLCYGGYVLYQKYKEKARQKITLS